MKKFRFREFQIYKDACEFRKELKLLNKRKFPKEEHEIYLKKAEKLANQLTAFRRKLLNAPTK